MHLRFCNIKFPIHFQQITCFAVNHGETFLKSRHTILILLLSLYAGIDNILNIVVKMEV